MFKKLMKGLVIGGAIFGMMGTASAADLDINLYGASAQHKFWSSMAAPFLIQYCDSTADLKYDKKHAMTIGTNCTVGNAGSQTTYDHINFRYSSRASYDGIGAVKGDGGYTRDMCNADCSALTAQTVNFGASDVAGESFVQTTSGWEDGYFNYPSDPYTQSFSGIDTTGLEQFQPIVVPFGFYVNNCVEEYRCTEPVAGAHKAYGKWGTSCVPNTPGADGISDDCVGYFKCLGWENNDFCSDSAYTNQEDCEAASETWTDSEILGTCNGGVNDGQSCDEADDCPDVAVADTMCTSMPIDNISQTMARQIFTGSNFVDQWTDFGPEYTIDPACTDQAGYIALCMRHAGSGTHATFDLVVMDGISIIQNSYAPYNIWHFTSSSDLTQCVTDIENSIGYADADKLLTFEEIEDVNGAHATSYNGAWPSQRNIVNGVYEFWAAQHIYYENDNLNADQQWLQANMETFAGTQANIDAIGKGAYWAASDAMKVKRLGGDGAPIVRITAGN